MAPSYARQRIWFFSRMNLEKQVSHISAAFHPGVGALQKSSKYKMWRQISNHTHSPGQLDSPNELKFGMDASFG